jgi:hypothetical protein
MSLRDELEKVVEAIPLYDKPGSSPNDMIHARLTATTFLRDHGQALVEALVDAERWRSCNLPMKAIRELGDEAREHVFCSTNLVGYVSWHPEFGYGQGGRPEFSTRPHIPYQESGWLCLPVYADLDTARSKTVDGGGV